jgi:uncharacterized coiled-coil protein SlyX
MVSRATTRLGLVFLVWFGAAALSPTSVSAQQPGIVELQRLVDERETEIARLEVRLRSLEQRGDSLSTAKREAVPGSARFVSISNQILESSQQITNVTRQLRVLYEQVRDLKTQLFLAYNEQIPIVQQEIDVVTSREPTDETDRELRRLVALLEDYVRARETLTTEIEEVEEDLFLPRLALDPRDGPAQLRVKEAIARDAVDKIDERIAAIEDQINKTLRKQRDLEEFQRIKDDIERDGQASPAGSVIERILSDRGVGGRTGPGDVFEDPDARLNALRRRRFDLVQRREDYSNKAEQFAERSRRSHL